MHPKLTEMSKSVSLALAGYADENSRRMDRESELLQTYRELVQKMLVAKENRKERQAASLLKKVNDVRNEIIDAAVQVIGAGIARSVFCRIASRSDEPVVTLLQETMEHMEQMHLDPGTVFASLEDIVLVPTKNTSPALVLANVRLYGIHFLQSIAKALSAMNKNAQAYAAEVEAMEKPYKNN